MESKILEVKKQMFEEFLPVLNKILQDANPSLYQKWQGNCCRQTAIFGCYILAHLLPHYEWETWVGEFNDVIYSKPQQYDHAWIFGKNPSNGMDLFVDLARIHKERIFQEVIGNQYPKNPDYEDMVELSRSKINWMQSILQDKEYYTECFGIKIANQIWTLMHKNHVMEAIRE